MKLISKPLCLEDMRSVDSNSLELCEVYGNTPVIEKTSIVYALRYLEELHNSRIDNIKDSASQYWLGYRAGMKQANNDALAAFPIFKVQQ